MDTELSELSRIRNNFSLVKVILDLQLILKKITSSKYKTVGIWKLHVIR